MKTALFAAFVAMLGSSNAVQLADVSAEGAQLNIAATSADVSEGTTSKPNTANAVAEGSTSGHSTSYDVSTHSDGFVYSGSDVESTRNSS